MKYKITFEANPHPKDLQKINKGIMDYAQQQKGHKPLEFFDFFIRDENNILRGGCGGNTLYGCLHIDQLWLEASLRGQGFGTQLVLAAEQFGQEQGCTFATVNTMDWEGLDFYKKLGYKVEFERHGFEKNSIFYFLRKDF